MSVAATVERIRDRVAHRLPKLGIVLSTGLQAVDGDAPEATVFSYADLPGFPKTSVPSHLGRLLVGKLAGHTVALLESHDDYYRSGRFDVMRAPIEVAAGLGCDKLLITAAAHSLKAELSPGQLVLVGSHVVFDAPAASQPVDAQPSYDPVMIERLKASAERVAAPLVSACFGCALDPAAPVPDPVAAKMGGADLIGQSLIPETMIARSLGLRVAALANIVDWAPGCAPDGISHDLAQQRADFTALHFRRLLADYLEHGGAD